MNLRAFTKLFMLAALALLPALARAQTGDSAAAQALFDEAKALMANGQAARACPKLEESQRLEPRSGTLINLASCYEQTGRLASAWSRYLDAATAAKASGHAEREAVARERAAALAPRLSRLVITVSPTLRALPGLQVKRDGVPVGAAAWGTALPFDAGPHLVTATAPGHVAFEAEVNIAAESSTTTLNLPELMAADPAKEPPATASNGLGTARVAALFAGGIGVVGVGLGAAFGIASKSKHNEAAKYCPNEACSDMRGVDAGNAAQKNGNISTAMMIVGGVGLAAGVTLWLTAPKPDSGAPSAQLGVGLGSLQLRGVL